jgi:flagellar basal body-associated protein FliL
MNEKEEKKDTTEESPGKVSKGKSKLPVMLGGGVLIVVILVVGGIFAMKSFTTKSEAANEKEPAVTEETPSEEGGIASTGFFFKEFEPFITVLEPSEEYDFTYLKFVPELEVSSEEALAEVLTKLPILSAQINSIMTDLNWNSIKSEKGRERLSKKIQERLNEHLESGKIVGVYFTTFVVQ